MMHLHTLDGATDSCGCCHLDGRMRVFWKGYPSLTRPYGEFTECRKAEFEQVKTMLNAISFISRLSRSISSDFGDFLIVINSNLNPMLYHFWDATTYWLKIANFFPPPLIQHPRWGWPILNLWKSFKDPETRAFQAADDEDLVIP